MGGYAEKPNSCGWTALAASVLRGEAVPGYAGYQTAKDCCPERDPGNGGAIGITGYVLAVAGICLITLALASWLIRRIAPSSQRDNTHRESPDREADRRTN